MTKEMICTVCPMGCHITVEGEGDQVLSVTGFSCKRGEQYATTEFAHPVRILTTTMKTDSEKNPLVPVRSAQPIPKEKIMDCMDVIRSCQVKTPVHTYEILLENICDTGVPIVATGTVE